MEQLRTPQLKDYIHLFILSAIWGTAFIGIEIAIANINIFQVTFGRVFVATLFLIPFLIVLKLKFPQEKRVWIIMFFASILNTTVPFSLINYGQQYISSGMSALMIGFGPFIALILGHFLTSDEKFKTYKLISVLFGFIGLVILVGENLLVFDFDKFQGQFAVFCAAICYVSASILIRKISGISSIMLSFMLFGFSTVTLLPFIYTIPLTITSYFDKSLLALIYLGIFPTALAAIYRIRMVQTIGVQFMVQVSYLIPIFALFWAWLILGEIPKISSLLALIFILTGLYIGKRNATN
jgi:drug/metabolite transporter (DMT)-like permease